MIEMELDPLFILLMVNKNLDIHLKNLKVSNLLLKERLKDQKYMFLVVQELIWVNLRILILDQVLTSLIKETINKSHNYTDELINPLLKRSNNLSRLIELQLPNNKNKIKIFLKQYLRRQKTNQKSQNSEG